MTPDDFPAHHPEWVQRDHMLIAWAQAYGLLFFHSGIEGSDDDLLPAILVANGAWTDVDLDPSGLPILTPELRQHLGDEWRKWNRRN